MSGEPGAGTLEARLSDLLEAAPDAMLVVDRVGKIVLSNSQADTLFGYAPAELDGRPVEDLVPARFHALHSGHRETYASDPRRRSMGAGLELFARRKDGGEFLAEISLSPVQVDGGGYVTIAAVRDVTASRMEQRLRTLMEHASDAVLVMDPRFKILEANRAAEILLDRPRTEIVGSTYTDLVVTEERVASAKHLAPVEGTVFSRHLLRSDGTRVTVEASKTAVRVGDQELLLAILRDVTQRERTTAALRQAQDRLEHIVSSNPAVLYALRPGGKASGLALSWISSNVERILGYSVAEAMESDWWVTRLHPDDAARVLGELDTLPATGLVEQEYRFRTSTGGYRWMRAELRLLKDAAGGPTEVVGSWSDVSARKDAELGLLESEQQYRLLFDGNPHPIYLVDEETLAFLAVNDAAVQHYGYSRDEFLGMTVSEIRPPEEVPALKRAIKQAEADHPSQSLALLRHRKKDGTVIQMEIAASKIHFRGRPAWLVLASDVTEKNTMEARLRQSQKMEAVGQLAGGIAHDFNNLLGVITGYSELLLKGRDAQDPDRRRLEQIGKAANRAAGLTRQLLAFSRKQVLQPRILDLNDVVSDVEKMLRRLIGEDIQFVTVFEPSIGRVRADPGQIEQVIVNLVVNARDAMPKGGRLVVATDSADLDAYYTRSRADVVPGRYVQLSVSDTGHGMDEGTMARIFEPFFTTKEPGKGTGLGLSTVYGIVKQSGGHVAVYSELGRGTTFKVYLPRVDAEAERRTAIPAPPAPRGTETILLLEDADALRMLVREMLEESGYAVIEGATPEEALAKAEQHSGPIQAVLTDVVLPSMSGPEFATRLASSRPEIRVIFMSGYAEAATGDPGLLGPETAFMQKPFTADALLRKMREVLDAPKGSHS